MTDGENKSDFQTADDFFVDGNGQAVNEQVITYMSKETKEQIEDEFEQLGVSSWQELMGKLINRRYKLTAKKQASNNIVTNEAPKAAPVVNTPEVKTGIRWWHIAVGGFVMVAMIVVIMKIFTAEKLPKIGFGQH